MERDVTFTKRNDMFSIVVTKEDTSNEEVLQEIKSLTLRSTHKLETHHQTEKGRIIRNFILVRTR